MAYDYKNHSQLLEFYTKQRNTVEHLYKSEKKYLPYATQHSDSVLDTGCAAGGFYGIYKYFNPDISYVGVDISKSLISEARKIHPEGSFDVIDCAREGKKFAQNEFDLVTAFGWLHWETEWEMALANLWSWSSEYILFDVRIGVKTEIGEQKIELTSEWDGVTKTPYIVVDVDSLSKIIAILNPKSVWGIGYKGKPSESVEGIAQEVCFAVFLLHKNGKKDDRLELPIKMNIKSY